MQWLMLPYAEESTANTPTVHMAVMPTVRIKTRYGIGAVLPHGHRSWKLVWVSKRAEAWLSFFGPAAVLLSSYTYNLISNPVDGQKEGFPALWWCMVQSRMQPKLRIWLLLLRALLSPVSVGIQWKLEVKFMYFFRASHCFPPKLIKQTELEKKKEPGWHWSLALSLWLFSCNLVSFMSVLGKA